MRGGRGSCGERVTAQTRSGRGMSAPERSAVTGGRGSLASETGERARLGAPGTEDGHHRDHHEEIGPGQGGIPHQGNLEAAAQTSPAPVLL